MISIFYKAAYVTKPKAARWIMTELLTNNNNKSSACWGPKSNIQTEWDLLIHLYCRIINVIGIFNDSESDSELKEK